MNNIIKKLLVIGTIVLIWQVGATLANTPLIFPRFSDTIVAFFEALFSKDGNLFSYVWETSKSLFSGYIVGIIIGALLTISAINTKIGEEFLVVITSAFAPLPAVAIFPLALMWFGITFKSIVFIGAFASVFPLAVSMTQGFKSVSHTLTEVGRNCGMSRLRLTCYILIPASLPSILSGLRTGFSNAFRALVAVEMVIGTTSGSGGLGWFVMSNKQNLDIPLVYAGIFSIMCIGLIFESFFTYFEKVTVKKWGMLR